MLCRIDCLIGKWRTAWNFGLKSREWNGLESTHVPIKVAVRCEVTRHITACFDEFKCVSRLQQQQSHGSRATYSNSLPGMGQPSLTDEQVPRIAQAVSLLKVCKWLSKMRHHEKSTNISGNHSILYYDHRHYLLLIKWARCLTNVQASVLQWKFQLVLAAFF